MILRKHCEAAGFASCWDLKTPQVRCQRTAITDGHEVAVLKLSLEISATVRRHLASERLCIRASGAGAGSHLGKVEENDRQ